VALKEICPFSAVSEKGATPQQIMAVFNYIKDDLLDDELKPAWGRAEPEIKWDHQALVRFWFKDDDRQFAGRICAAIKKASLLDDARLRLGTDLKMPKVSMEPTQEAATRAKMLGVYWEGLQVIAQEKSIVITSDCLFYGTYPLGFSSGGNRHMLGFIKDGGIIEWSSPGARIPLLDVEQPVVLERGLLARR